jgi:hypothetical protein
MITSQRLTPIRNAMRWSSGSPPWHSATPLHLDRALNGLEHARKLHERAVAHQLDDAAVMLGDRRLDELPTQGFQPGDRAGLVDRHQPQVADHVGGQDGREPPRCHQLSSRILFRSAW